MTLIEIKASFAVAVLVAGLLSVFEPLRIASNKDLLSLANMMASGVLLAAGLVHQLADSSNAFKSHECAFPWAPFIAGTTFIVFLVLETHINLYLQGKPSLAHLIHSHGSDTSDGEDAVENHNHSNNDASHALLTRNTTVEDGSKYAAECENRPLVEPENDRNHSNHGSMVASLLLMLAISVHSILAGVAIGIETNVQSITSTAVAILAHKSFEGFALGSSMVGANMPTKLYVALGIIFGFATPGGAIIGMVIDSELDEDSAIVAIVQAMVAGTFLYISIVEIGLKELSLSSSHHDHGVILGPKQIQLEYRKLLSFATGFMLMSFLAIFV